MREICLYVFRSLFSFMKLQPLPISFRLGFACLLLALMPLQAVATDEETAAVRTLQVIEKDDAGVNLSYPSTIFYDAEADEIYLTDAAKGQVVIYAAADYFPQLSVGKGRGLQAIYSSYVKDGTVYFCVGRGADDPRGHIAVFSSALLPLRDIYFSGIPGHENFLPREMVIGSNGLLYVVGVNSSAVMVFDRQGNFLRELLPRDEVLGVAEPASILSLTIDREGRLYLLSEERGRVFVYDRDENLLFKFGQKGGGSGKLARPRGIAVDDQRGRIYIVDYLRHTASVYSIEGKYLYEFGGMGVGRGWFYYPTDVAVDGRGHVLITDTFNHRVQVFRMPASVEMEDPATVLGNPETAVPVDDHGN